MSFGGTPAEAARLGFPASLAVAELFDHLAPGVRVTLKWPNDVLLGGRKASGILLENFGRRMDRDLTVAIGVGVNLASHPQSSEIRWPATSIAEATGSRPEFETAFALLAECTARWLAILERQGFGIVRSAWLARAERLGEVIDARLPCGTVIGRFADIDADGALVLQTAEGTRRIAAGDVFFRECG
jgi:BirA family biotin operon repressor/biotin-[acetyl-CoA-carboxylase] ligase